MNTYCLGNTTNASKVNIVATGGFVIVVWVKDDKAVRFAVPLVSILYSFYFHDNLLLAEMDR